MGFIGILKLGSLLACVNDVDTLFLPQTYRSESPSGETWAREQSEVPQATLMSSQSENYYGAHLRFVIR